MSPKLNVKAGDQLIAHVEKVEGGYTYRRIVVIDAKHITPVLVALRGTAPRDEPERVREFIGGLHTDDNGDKWRIFMRFGSEDEQESKL